MTMEIAPGESDPIDLRVREVERGHARGWSFTPLNGKAPVRKGWQKHGRENLETAVSWAKANNVGLRTGAHSGIVVIDDDTADGSAEITLSLPSTVTVITGSGKKHHYFKSPGFPIKNSVRKLGPGIDVRADGGQVVFVGSIHPDTGKPYTWTVGRSPDEIAVAELPPDLLDRLKAGGSADPSNPKLESSARSTSGNIENVGAASTAKPTPLDREAEKKKEVLDRYTRSQLLVAQAKVRYAAVGTRNETLNAQAFRMGRYVRAGLIARVEVLGSLWGAAVAAGLTPDESKRTIDSAISKRSRRELDLGKLYRQLTARATRKQIAEAAAKAATAAPGLRVQVVVVPGTIHETVDQLDTVLARQSPPPLYVRGDILVRVLSGQLQAAGGGPSASRSRSLIKPVEVSSIIDVATRHIEFRALTAAGTLAACDCPRNVAEIYQSRGHWRLRTLLAVVECPTLRSDGSILNSAGYDETSGLYVEFGGATPPAIPDSPTPADIKRAFEVVIEPFRLFPFLNEADRAVALAALFTAIVRRSIRTAPLFAIRAPVMASGKSLIADVIAIIATGRCAPAMSLVEDQNENRKRLFALLLQGEPISLLDNLEVPLGGPSLCTALTQDWLQDRILGKSRTACVPTCTTWIATGNNLIIYGDAVTRCVVCDLDPGCERPEERRFVGSLRTTVTESRLQIAAAVVTLLRAFVVAGRPKQAFAEFGRFEEWSDLVRSCIVWLGLPDPCSTRDRLTRDDSETEQLAGLLTVWFDHFGSKTVTVREVLTNGLRPDLREVLLDIGATNQNDIEPRKIGKFLTKYAGRIARGHLVEKSGNRSGVATWRVRRVDALRAESTTLPRSAPAEPQMGGAATVREAGGVGFVGLVGIPPVPHAQDEDPAVSSTGGAPGVGVNGSHPTNPPNPRDPYPPAVALPEIGSTPHVADRFAAPPALPTAPCLRCGSTIHRDPLGDGRWTCDHCGPPRSAAGADALWAVADGKRALGPFSEPADADAAARALTPPPSTSQGEDS